MRKINMVYSIRGNDGFMCGFPADSPVMLREAKMKLWSTERCNRKESFDNEVDGNLKVCAGFDAGLPTACSVSTKICVCPDIF